MGKKKIVLTKGFEKSLRKLSNTPETAWESISWNIIRPLKWIQDKLRELKWALQRARYGIDDTMTWNLDLYLADHIVKLLRQYHSQANRFVVMTGEGTHRHNDGRDFGKWIKDLTESFESYRNLRESDPFLLEKGSKTKMKELKQEMQDLFGELYEALWW